MKERSYILAFVALVALAGRLGLADDESVREYQLKAAFIYKFTQFIEWPSSAFSSDDDPIIVAIVGDDPFHGDLDRAAADKKTGNRPMLIKHFADVDHIERCHMLFVAASQADQMPAVLRKISDWAVVTIGDNDSFCRDGGVIRFFIEDQRIHFEINTSAAERAGVKISSRLLQLARIYQP